MDSKRPEARLAQSAERKALNLVVVGSSPTVGVFHRTRSNPGDQYTQESNKPNKPRKPYLVTLLVTLLVTILVTLLVNHPGKPSW